ncbi:MAG: hypothetical protein E4H13_14405, partial [Calditrichales bacterium]
MKNIVCGFLCTLFLIPVCLYGQDEILSGFQEHDGFFLRFHAGYGSAKMLEEGIMGTDMTLS